MAGKMTKREDVLSKRVRSISRAAKSFHAPQKPNSKRLKRKVRLNNYKKED